MSTLDYTKKHLTTSTTLRGPGNVYCTFWMCSDKGRLWSEILQVCEDQAMGYILFHKMNSLLIYSNKHFMEHLTDIIPPAHLRQRFAMWKFRQQTPLSCLKFESRSMSLAETARVNQIWSKKKNSKKKHFLTTFKFLNKK